MSANSENSKNLIIPLEVYDQFDSFFETILEDILSLWNVEATPLFVSSYYEELIKYNVYPGKHLRAQFFILASNLVNKVDTTRVFAFAWILEIFQAASLIGDDITDNSTSRRGQKCWHLKKSVGLTAVNDMVLLENVGYALLRKYFAESPYYLTLSEILQENTLKMCIGQGLDLLASKNTDVTSFDMTLYKEIVFQKTSNFGFGVPIASALIMKGLSKTEVVERTENFTREIGLIFQIQDDFKDVFGDPNIEGKTSTDISNGKCAWPIVVALERANPTQRLTLIENYGKPNSAQVNIVKSVFAELEIKQEYQKSMALMRQNIEIIIANSPESSTGKEIVSTFGIILRKVLKIKPSFEKSAIFATLNSSNG
ncbi:unnamed protein product [Allacma fusca]|uniref:Farnesyl pyrophosphate synthase n=1 Tax=Allacma fusca TaxID=39272 RepID=A0A8J2KVE4_9HEXA|nr:unnamed protein product [Allacma fusca]